MSDEEAPEASVKVRFKNMHDGKGGMVRQVSGSVYHTESHVHGHEHIDVPLETAELFGLKECHICQRRRLFRENLDNAIVFMGIENGKAHLRVYGQNLKIEAGKMALPLETYGNSRNPRPWTISDIPEDIAALLGIADEEEEQ